MLLEECGDETALLRSGEVGKVWGENVSGFFITQKR